MTFAGSTTPLATPGQRHRSATWLAVIVVLAGLLGAGSYLASGAGATAARTTTPGGKGTAIRFRAGDDWRHVWAQLQALKDHPVSVPVVYLLGGSAARECTIDDLTWCYQLQRMAGIHLRTYNLGACNQTYDNDLKIVSQMLPKPSLVFIGINVGRYTRVAPGTATAGGPTFEARTASTAAHLGPLGTVQPYYQHRFTVSRILSNAQKRQVLHQWLAKTYPIFKQRYAYNEGQLEAVVQACLTAGLHPVLINLPLNMQIIGHRLDAPLGRYAADCRSLAQKYSIPYIDFVSDIGLVSGDFRDLWHLVEPGRVKWQKKLSKVSARLLKQYGMTNPSPAPSPSASPPS